MQPKSVSSDDRLLTRSEVENRFGISRSYLEKSGLKGDGPPFVRVGRSVRYRVADLLAWIDRNRIDPSAPHTGVPLARLRYLASPENGVQAVTQTKTLTTQNKDGTSDGQAASTGER